MLTTRIISFFSIFLAAEAARFHHNSRMAHQLIRRQTATSSSDDPCTATCTPFLQECAPGSPSCAACSAKIQQDLQTCLNCLSTETSLAPISANITSFNSRCASSGFTVTIPSSVATAAEVGASTVPGAAGGAVPSGATGGGIGPGAPVGAGPGAIPAAPSAGNTESTSNSGSGSNSGTNSNSNSNPQGQQKNAEILSRMRFPQLRFKALLSWLPSVYISC
ncbi:hypothetical protein CPB84DRAFT_1778572, partial [Gymnopilus junonius]